MGKDALFRPIPIRSYAVCCALGTSADAVADALLAGRSGLGPSPLTLPFETVCGAVGPLPALSPAHAAFDTRAARIVEVLLRGIDPVLSRAVDRWGPRRVAVLLGATNGGLDATDAAVRAVRSEGALPADFDLDRKHALFAAVDYVRVSRGIEGPGFTISTACASGGEVFAAARRMMAAGFIDAAVVGGVDTLCNTTLHGFHGLGILSAVACRPFGAARDGLNLGEGGALFVLEREGTGVAQLLGAGEGFDGHHMSSPHPAGVGSRAAMLGALANAGLSPRDVDHVNAHGTGTPLNDAVEGRALADLFGKAVPIVATKGATGHALGAAGAIEAALAVISIERGMIPPSLGATPLDPALAIDVTREARSNRARVVLSNSFGFGGANVSLLLGAPA